MREPGVATGVAPDGEGSMTDGGVPPLFVRLVDDAGLFPPEELPMPAAVTRHRRDQAARLAVLSGKFVCPAARLGELLAELEPGERLPLALVTRLDRDALERGIAALSGEDRVLLAGIEGPMEDPGALDAVPAGVQCYAEIPVTGDWQAPLQRLTGSGHAAKARCGGLRAELFPTAGQLGGFVHACAVAGVPFKATAGLHHALPYRDAHTGFSHHGFLNLLLAACRAVDGATAQDVAAVLEVTGAATLVSEAAQASPGLAARARSLFHGYGSCSTADPVDDLRRLGLVSTGGRA